MNPRRDGQKIFRYNRRTHNIELADGRGLNDEIQTKKALADLAKAAWNDKNFNGKVSFKPSKKFRDKAQEIFGHDVTEIFITGSDIRHIKKKYGTNEDARGQIDMTPEMIPNIYDVVNDFDFAEEGKTDNLEQKAIEVTKNINCRQGYVITVERGAKKADVKTALKRKKPQVLDTEGSEQNVRNDPATSSNENTTQGEEEIKYSLGNSDNSSESLTQKIKNKMSSYFDDSRPSERRGKRIKDALQKITGYRILFSHTNSDETIVDDFNKLIQAKHAYEWEKLLPQIGGKIAQRLKLNPNSEQSNYIADWLLTGALNNTSAEAKNFQKAMRENPEVAQLLQDVRNNFQEISDMSVLERYKSKIVHKEKKPLIQRLWGERKNIIEQWFDDLHPIKRMVQKMKKTASPEVAKMIDEMIDPYKMARLVRSKGALADLMIETDKENIEEVRNAFREQNPFMKFNRLKSLAMIIEEASGKENLEDFEAFCVAKLDKEIYEKNRANPDGKQITPMDTEENADTAIKAGEKNFGTAQRSLVTYSNILLTMQFNTGLISQKQYS